MKKCLMLMLLVVTAGGSATADAAWPKPEVVLGPGLASGRVTYNQTWNRTLSPDTLYALTGLYSVDSTYTLTIPAGTVVRGDTASALVIKRGGRIYAMGEPCNPVVLTSLKDPGQRNRGDWGGVLICGQAPVNKVEPLIEGGIIQGTYGGSIADDNSGVFKYVRIEYPGYRFRLNNETNGLTMGGVGTGTEIHHVQVTYSFDDGFEWFGGTVNAHHLVNFAGTDDDFDTDFGWAGHVQYAFGMKDLNLWDPTGETNGFESDNDGSATSTATPYTACVFSNATLIGPERTDAIVGNLPVGHKFQYSALLRRSTRHSIHNSVIMGFPWGIRLRDAFTITHATTDLLQVRNTSIQASLRPVGSTSVHDEALWAGITTWFNTAGWNNLGAQPRNPSAIGLTDLSSLSDPNPVPTAGSELDGSADFSSAQLAGFEVVGYRGAFVPGLPMDQQWTACWTNFSPSRVTFTGVGDGDAPVRAQLSQNYPNPFNPMTAIRFKVPARGHVTLKVFDVRGREMATVVDGEMIAGAFERSFDASGLSSGTYFYRLTAPGVNEVRKMQLVK